MPEPTLSERLAFSTILIQCETSGGEASIGTGFFFSIKLDEKNHVPVVVTNNHVVNNATTGLLRLTRADTQDKPVIGSYDNILMENFKGFWVPHPDDGIDLCIMPLAPILTEAQKRNLSFYYQTFPHESVPSEQQLQELDALEDILMIGYPIGLWDASNNMPIFRRGITATHPNIDYGGQKIFLIDAACFPGSSGSPVMLYDRGAFRDRQGTLRVGPRAYLLGVLFAGPQYTVQGKLEVKPIPTVSEPIPVSRIPVNLGYVIKSQCLLDFIPIVRNMVLARGATG